MGTGPFRFRCSAAVQKERPLAAAVHESCMGHGVNGKESDATHVVLGHVLRRRASFRFKYSIVSRPVVSCHVVSYETSTHACRVAAENELVWTT